MKTNAETQRTRTRRAYEQRTELQVTPIRLSVDARERLARLAARYGGKREAVEAALIELERRTLT